MNYLQIDKASVSNGIGIRCVLWLSGCEHRCFNCQNKESWNAHNGTLFTEKTQKIILDYLKNDYVDGITFSGGDPLYSSNVKEVLLFSKEIKEILPNKDIWIYTGYTWESICNLDNLKYVDVIVDGKYKDSLKDTTLAFRGSSNQRIIDVPYSLNNNCVKTLNFI